MKIVGNLLISAVLAFCASLVVAALFLPVYGIFEGGPHNCLNDGVGECLSFIPLSALIYGPLFCLTGVLIGTPVFMVILAWRD